MGIPLSAREVEALHEEYLQGKSLHDLAQRQGVSHETIRQLFVAHDLPRRSAQEIRAQRRGQVERQAEAEREQIIARYKQCGSIDAVMESTSLPRQAVSEIVKAIPNREAYRRRAEPAAYSPEDLRGHIRRAAQSAGEPLSGMAYQKLASSLGLAAYATQVRHFGSFAQACQSAGVKFNSPRGKRSGSISEEDCIKAVAECIQESGGRVSYRQYREWASRNSGISGPTIRVVVPGGWSAAVEAALAVTTALC